MDIINKSDTFKITYVCPECGKHIEFDVNLNINIPDNENFPSNMKVELIDQRFNILMDKDLLFINCPFCKKETMNKIDRRALELYESFVKKGYTFSTKNFIPYSVETDCPAEKKCYSDNPPLNYVPIYEIIINIDEIFQNIFYRFFNNNKYRETFKQLTQENLSYLFGDLFHCFEDKEAYEDNLDTILDNISYDIANYHHIFFKLFKFPKDFNTRINYYTIENKYEDEYCIPIYADRIENLFDWCKELPDLRDINVVINLIREYYTSIQ